MSVVQGSFSATDRTRDPADQFAEIRQKVVDSLHQTLDSTKHGELFPIFLIEAVENEIWKYPRKLTHGLVPAMPLLEFIKAPYPRGLGTSVSVIEKLISRNEKAMLAWDRAVRGEHGGAREGAGRKAASQELPPHDPETGEIKSDNVTLEKGQVDRRGGNSSQQGLRRLEKAADAGDGNAVDLLRRVLDPNDAMTVNGACVAMGWRKHTKTVVDTPDGLSDAVVRSIGPLDTVKQAWRCASHEQREEIAAWVDTIRGVQW
jgi:hypothetical protein